eukprot:128159-Lingulodinium_polyedra.AAC.1
MKVAEPGRVLRERSTVNCIGMRGIFRDRPLGGQLRIVRLRSGRAMRQQRRRARPSRRREE